MRKKDDTLRDTLLALARRTADTKGMDAINIRTLAENAGVATGTVYNYFSGKDEILLALTEEYWRQALAEMKTVITASSFCGQLEEIFFFLRESIHGSAGKLMGSLGSVEAAGHARMMSMQSALEAVFIKLMEQDPDISGNIWKQDFTKDQFAHFIMMNLMILLKTDTPDIDFLLSVVSRILYNEKESL